MKLTAEQISKIQQPTPIDQLEEKDMGYGVLTYVSIGYIIDVLNDIFNFDWSFEVTDQQVGNVNVYVRGKLTVGDISKEQYGGSAIKFTKEIYKDGILVKPSKVMDIGNDLKSASSDALKKCASLFGIASDVYNPK